MSNPMYRYDRPSIIIKRIKNGSDIKSHKRTRTKKDKKSKLGRNREMKSGKPPSVSEYSLESTYLIGIKF